MDERPKTEIKISREGLETLNGIIRKKVEEVIMDQGWLFFFEKRRFKKSEKVEIGYDKNSKWKLLVMRFYSKWGSVKFSFATIKRLGLDESIFELINIRDRIEILLEKEKDLKKEKEETEARLETIKIKCTQTEETRKALQEDLQGLNLG